MEIEKERTGFLNSTVRLYRLFILFLFVTGIFASAQNVGFSIGSGSATPGGTAVLNISIASTGGAQPAAVQWTLGYSATDISSITVTTGAAATAAGKSVTCSSVSGGMTCLVFGLNTTVIADGVVAQATVQVAAGTTDATTSLQL